MAAVGSGKQADVIDPVVTEPTVIIPEQQRLPVRRIGQVPGVVLPATPSGQVLGENGFPAIHLVHGQDGFEDFHPGNFTRSVSLIGGHPVGFCQEMAVWGECQAGGRIGR